MPGAGHPLQAAGQARVGKREPVAACVRLAVWDIVGCNVAVEQADECDRRSQARDQLEPWRVCKTVPCDWSLNKIQKAAGRSVRRLTDLLTRPVGTKETT